MFSEEDTVEQLIVDTLSKGAVAGAIGEDGGRYAVGRPTWRYVVAEAFRDSTPMFLWMPWYARRSFA